MFDKKVFEIYNFLKDKPNLTEIENDILDSIHDLYIFPIKKDIVIARIKQNNHKYPFIKETEILRSIAESGVIGINDNYSLFTNYELKDELGFHIKMLYDKSKSEAAHGQGA